MTGYWRDDIERGHKTGPYRTSIRSIIEYEKIYLDPFGINSYRTAGFIKKRGVVSADSTMFSAKNIDNLNSVSNPDPYADSYRVYSNENVVRKVFKILGYHFV
jgi:hypothetical protein